MIDNAEANEGMRPVDEMQPPTKSEGLDGTGTGSASGSDSAEVDPLDLTDQEQATLAGLAAGESRMAVAEALGMSVASVDSSVASALRKLHRLNRRPGGPK